MTIDRTHDAAEPDQPASPTAHLLDELQLYGFSPAADEPDRRPLPEAPKVEGALADIFDALVTTLGDSRLEPDLPDLLWSIVNVFHRAVERVGRKLDDNERAQRSSQREQDGSEIRSVELERLIAEGLSLVERRNSFDFMRDHAAELYEVHTGHAWRPRAGSLASRRTMTAAMIDSRDFLMAKRRAETELMLPPGPKIAFTGGIACSDHQNIWAVGWQYIRYRGMPLRMRLREVVAKNLRTLRHARGLSQEELANRAGVNRNYIGMLEREENSPTIDMLEKLAEALDTDPVELLAGRRASRRR